MKGRGIRDKSKIRCYNCQVYAHFTAEYRKPRRMNELKQEVFIAQTEDDEPTLLSAKHDKKCDKIFLIEKNVDLRLVTNGKKKGVASNLWNLDNGARKHMTCDF